MTVADIGYRPRPWQAEERARLKRWNVLVIHRRAGKTIFSVATLIDSALRTQKAHARYAYIAPKRNQAKAVAWDYIKRMSLKVPDTVPNESELHVTFTNGSRITIYGADDPDALRGLYLDGAVIDEVADMKPHTWGEVLRPALADRHGWAIFIGTPKGQNLLHDIYHEGLRDDAWYSDLRTYLDTGEIPDEEIESMKRTMSDAQFRQEMLCEWQASSDDILIPMDMVRAAQARALRPEQYDYAPVVLGIDVARMGGDRAAIARRQGNMVWPVETWQGVDNVSFAMEITRRIDDYKPKAVFIDAGRGEGVHDILKRLGYDTIMVDFGGTKGVGRAYVNKAAQMWDSMCRGIRESWALPAGDRRLAAALSSRHYTFANAANKLGLVPKKDEKGHLDEGDALALTTAFPVAMALGREYDAVARNAPAQRAVFDDILKR